MLAKEKWQISTINVLEKFFEERKRQVARYGHNRDIEDGTGPDVPWLLPFTEAGASEIEIDFRDEYEAYENKAGLPTWVRLLREEFAEAVMEDDDNRKIEELVQLGALCASWIEVIEWRAKDGGDS